MRVDTGRLRVVAPAPVEPSGPEPVDASPSPGAFLREHRQRRGLSIDQLAAVTKIPRRSLEALEEDRYADLPGPVFVKGFLRCCARSLGLEQENVIELLYERERAALASRRREWQASGPHPQAMTRPVTGPVDRAPARQASALLERVIDRITQRLTTTNLLLWLVVVLFVAVVAMAAFNLVGAGSAVSPQVPPG